MNTNIVPIGIKLDQQDIESCLMYLCHYGEPRLLKMGHGWHACIKVFVTGEGVQFEVKSTFDEPNPRQALNICIERLKKAFKEIGVEI